MPGVARVGYYNHAYAYEFWRDETAPVGRAEPFFASSVLQLPRAHMPLAHGQKLSCLLPLPPFRTVDKHFGHPFEASIALCNAFAA